MLGCITGCEPGCRGCQVGLSNQLLWTGDLALVSELIHTALAMHMLVRF